MKAQSRIPVALTAAQARSNLGQIIRRASATNSERFVIGERGGSKAIVMGLGDYLDAILQKPDALARMQELAAVNGTSNMAMDEIDAEIAAYRTEQRAAQRD